MKHGSSQVCPACQFQMELTCEEKDTSEAKDGDVVICEKCCEISYYKLEGGNLELVRGTTEMFDKLPYVVQFDVSSCQLSLMWNLHQ